MPEIELDFTKTAQQNALECYDKAKKAKKKLSGIAKATKELQGKLEKEKERKETVQVKEPAKKRKTQWFEKFRWFYSSDGFLVLGGRDAQNNETLIKKYMDQSDLYFHADVYGAAHCLIKSTTGKAPSQTMKEAAAFAAVMSKAWKDKVAAADVYSVKPGQVSKTTPSGESIGKGAFMIYGERKWFKKTALNFGLGLKEEAGNLVVFSGPVSAVKKNCGFAIEIKQGKSKSGALAKKVKAKLLEKFPQAKIELDEIIKMLPAGESDLA